MSLRSPVTLVMLVLIAGFDSICRDGSTQPFIPLLPLDEVGADVPLQPGEREQLKPCLTAQGYTEQAIQAVCQNAEKSGIKSIYLPAGEYLCSVPVRIPAGVVLFGDGCGTVCRTYGKTHGLFVAGGNDVRLTRLQLEGPSASRSTNNNAFALLDQTRERVRVDHCELSGFSYAISASDGASLQVDHCFIHHNLRDGMGYAVVAYSGAYALVISNEFSQNRHSLASNGSIDWKSAARAGKYLHRPTARKTHWEFRNNYVHGDDLTQYGSAAVDAHPGMDGTFRVEDNLFEDLRCGIGIRDGSGVITRNVFHRLHFTERAPAEAIVVALIAQDGIPVDGALPHDISIAGNRFENCPTEHFTRYQIGDAARIFVTGFSAQVDNTAAAEEVIPTVLVPRLAPMQ